MKKILSLCFTAALFITIIGSCSKDSATDLTTNIVGVYVGAIADTIIGGQSTGATGISMTVTKIDNTHVQVTSPSGSSYISFTAALSTAPNGIYGTIQSGSYNGITYTGGTFVAQIPSGYNAAFSNSGGLGYSISANNGAAYYEIYAGNK